jgi:hypothetical protein
MMEVTEKARSDQHIAFLFSAPILGVALDVADHIFLTDSPRSSSQGSPCRIYG